MKDIMKKNFTGKELILLLAFASIVSISESQAATRMDCPTPKSMEVHISR